MSKEQIKSLFDTFFSTFLLAILVNLDQLDLNHLTGGAIMAFIITILRDVVKRIGQMYLDKRAKSLDNQV